MANGSGRVRLGGLDPAPTPAPPGMSRLLHTYDNKAGRMSALGGGRSSESLKARAWSCGSHFEVRRTASFYCGRVRRLWENCCEAVYGGEVLRWSGAPPRPHPAGAYPRDAPDVGQQTASAVGCYRARRPAGANIRDAVPVRPGPLARILRVLRASFSLSHGFSLHGSSRPSRTACRVYRTTFCSLSDSFRCHPTSGRT